MIFGLGVLDHLTSLISVLGGDICWAIVIIVMPAAGLSVLFRPALPGPVRPSGPPGPPMGGRAPGRAKTLAFRAKLPSTVLFFRSPGGLSPNPRVAIFFIGEGGGEEPAEDEAVGAGARRPANDETLSIDSCESRAGGIIAQQRGGDQQRLFSSQRK